MWKRIKRILKNAILFPVLIAFAKGHYEEGDPPELLTTEYTEDAMSGLENLAYGDIKLPGVTGEESQLLNWGMGLIEKMVSGEMPEAYTLGMNKIKNILGGEYDPTTSPYYEGLKEESARFEEKGAGDIRQRGQMGGMLYSEPAMGIESDFRGQIGTGLTKELGRLFESNINREASMIPSLLGYSQAKTGMMGQALSGIGGLSGLAGKSGDIARQERIGGLSGLAGKSGDIARQETLLPYTVQAPIMEALADWGTW